MNLQTLFFLTLQKAFDVIDHFLLQRKLELYRLPPIFLRLMSSFLSNRTQLVSINNSSSKFQPVKYGVPQGSVLGPPLFFYYILTTCPVLSNVSVRCSQMTLPSDHMTLTLPDYLQRFNMVLIDLLPVRTEPYGLKCAKNKMHVCECTSERQKLSASFQPLFTSM